MRKVGIQKGEYRIEKVEHSVYSLLPSLRKERPHA